jgi:hypothetical protein
MTATLQEYVNGMLGVGNVVIVVIVGTGLLDRGISGRENA